LTLLGGIAHELSFTTKHENRATTWGRPYSNTRILEYCFSEDPTIATALLIATNRGRLAEIERVLSSAGWHVVAFHDAHKALEQLKSGGYRAIFCDYELRGASAQGFLAWQRRLAPAAPFYLIGADMPPRGAKVELLPFPLPLTQTPVPPDTPMPQAPVQREIPLAGDTALIPLSDLLAMIGLAGQSATVEFGASGEVGTVGLERGTLTHAETAQQHGLKALAALLVAGPCLFRVLPPRPSVRATVNLPVAAALTEAARLADEQRRYRGLIEAVAAACPSLLEASAGYLLGASELYNVTNEAGLGASPLFGLAKRLIEAQRQALGSRPLELYLLVEDYALALCLFGDDNLLVAKAPAAHAEALYRAVQHAVRHLPNG